jgi:hypothetical protein
MEGLLKRAIRLREELQIDHFSQDDELNNASGISAEDRREILQQIEQVANKNKIAVTPELFRIKAVKKGFLMPLFSWIIAIIFGFGAYFGLELLFQSRETLSETEQGIVQNVEAEILEAQRRDAESRLNAKDDEISSINSQLANIQSDLASLEANVDAEVEARETELRLALEEELARERERLQGQGLSEADVEAAIGAFEAERNLAFESQLNQFRLEQEAEREQQAATLRQAQQDFNTRLAQANNEKAALEEQVAEKTSELEAEIARLQEQSDEQLSEATEEIERLSQLQEEEARISNQLIGFYTRIRTDINASNFSSARNNLQLLNNFLSTESFFTVESLRQRRDTELFLVDSLDSLIATRERSRETASLLESASVLTEVDRLVSQAQAAAQGGNTTRAEQVYEEALELIPAVKNSFEYVQAQEVNRNEKNLKDALDSLETSLTTRYTNLIDEQQNDFESQLARLNSTNSDLQEEIATQKELIQTLQNQVASIQQQLSSSESELSEASTEVTRLTTALRLSEQQLSQAQSDLEAERERVSNLSSSQGASSEEVVALQTRLDELENQASLLEQQNEELQNLLDQSNTDSIDPQLIIELENLREQSIIYNNMVEAYQNYTNQEDRTLASNGDFRYVQGKVLLDEFLSNADVAAAFPGLSERLSVYDQEFEAAGQENIAFELADVILIMSSFPDTQDRLNYIDEQIDLLVEQDQAKREFYDNLKFLISN